MALQILITGTSRGIGYEIARYYLEQGCIVYGCSRSTSTIKHERYMHFITDVSNESSVKALFLNLKKHTNTLDVLVNNAGTASMNHFLLTPLSSVQKLFQTNFIGTFLFTREASKIMKRNKRGRIINFSTVAVPLRLQGEAVYAATKAAVVNLTETLANELAEYGITINAIGPTPVETDLIKAVPQSKINELIGRQAIKRLGTFQDIINVIEFLIRPSSDFITGQIIYLGGVIK